MGFVDMTLAIGIIGGAIYLLYRSIRKQKGDCPGCNHGECGKGTLKDPENRPSP